MGLKIKSRTLTRTEIARLDVLEIHWTAVRKWLGIVFSREKPEGIPIDVAMEVLKKTFYLGYRDGRTTDKALKRFAKKYGESSSTMINFRAEVDKASKAYLWPDDEDYPPSPPGPSPLHNTRGAE